MCILLLEFISKNKERILQENNGYTLLDAGVKLISKWENLNECEKQKFRISAKELNSELIFEFKWLQQTI